MSIFGTDLSDARRYLGSLRQVARIDSFVEQEGLARGARRMRIITGGGLEIDLHPDRALDIGQVTVGGMPLAWIEPQGISAPWFYDPHGAGWLRMFGGGLVTTCGLETFGPPSSDNGVELGQHGRVSAIPAEITRREDDGDELVVAGIVRQSTLHGENLVLRRVIRAPLGGRSFVIEDTVTNEGPAPADHMMMYHVNFGWPMVEPGARLLFPPTRREPRDEITRAGLDRWDQFDAPRPDANEEVLVHHFEDPPGETAVTLVNENRGLKVALDFDRTQLPWLCEWKFQRDGTYVLGLEPVNSPAMGGRARARQDGVLPSLAPGETVEYRVGFRIDDA